MAPLARAWPHWREWLLWNHAECAKLNRWRPTGHERPATAGSESGDAPRFSQIIGSIGLSYWSHRAMMEQNIEVKPIFSISQTKRRCVIFQSGNMYHNDHSGLQSDAYLTSGLASWASSWEGDWLWATVHLKSPSSTVLKPAYFKLKLLDFEKQMSSRRFHQGESEEDQSYQWKSLWSCIPGTGAHFSIL